MRENEYKNIFKNEYEMKYAYKNILQHCEEKGWVVEKKKFSPENLAELMDKLRNVSQRYMASLVFKEDDIRHNNQLFGRDAKLWAASIVGNLEEAISSWAN